MEHNNNLNVDELNAVSSGMNDSVPDSPHDAPQPLPPCPICGSHRIENALFDENGVPYIQLKCRKCGTYFGPKEHLELPSEPACYE